MSGKLSYKHTIFACYAGSVSYTHLIGHVRYGTTGNSSRTNAQPITINHEKGRLSVVHNGNLTNAAELRHLLEMNGSIFHTTADTEIIAYVVTAERISHENEEEAVSAAMSRLKGAYSCVLMFEDKLIALRDEHGFRPLCYGKTSDGSVIVASESCALEDVYKRQTLYHVFLLPSRIIFII